MDQPSHVVLYKAPLPVLGLCVLLGAEWHDFLFSYFASPASVTNFYNVVRFTAAPYNGVVVVALLWTLVMLLRKLCRDGYKLDILSLILLFLIAIPYGLFLAPMQEQVAAFRLPAQRVEAERSIKTLGYGHAAVFVSLLLLVYCQLSSHTISIPESVVDEAEHGMDDSGTVVVEEDESDPQQQQQQQQQQHRQRQQPLPKDSGLSQTAAAAAAAADDDDEDESALGPEQATAPASTTRHRRVKSVNEQGDEKAGSEFLTVSQPRPRAKSNKRARDEATTTTAPPQQQQEQQPEQRQEQPQGQPQEQPQEQPQQPEQPQQHEQPQQQEQPQEQPQKQQAQPEPQVEQTKPPKPTKPKKKKETSKVSSASTQETEVSAPAQTADAGLSSAQGVEDASASVSVSASEVGSGSGSGLAQETGGAKEGAATGKKPKKTKKTA